MAADICSSSGNDPYQLLGVDRNAERGEIRKRYQELARKFHPDKLDTNITESDREAATNTFQKLSHAYHMLTNDVTRHQHDVKTRAKEMTDTLIINDSISLSDMTLDNDDYSSDCRCGGKYYISKKLFDSSNNKDCHIIGCDTCSLHIKIIL